MKKKKLCLSALYILSISVCFLLLHPFFKENIHKNVKALDEEHYGYHYEASDDYVEFWTCCNCHETFLSKPASGTFIDAEASNMSGGVPQIAKIEKSIQKLPSSLDSLSTFEKVKAANILYTLNSEVLTLNELDKSKLSLNVLETAKADYDLYLTPIFGFNNGDNVTPIDNDQQITSVSKITNKEYGSMYDATFSEEAKASHHIMQLNNLNISINDYESIALIVINDLQAWGTSSTPADILHLFNGDEKISSGIAGYLNDDGFGLGVSLIDVTISNSSSLITPRLSYQNTWGPTTKGHTHLFFTGLFGIKNFDLSSLTNQVIDNINNATSKVISTNEEAAQVTLLAKLARENYEKLPTSAKSAVTNLDDLETLEKTLSNYTYLLETSAIKPTLSSDNSDYLDYSLTSKVDENYGNIKLIQFSKAVDSAINLNFTFSIGENAVVGYSKLIIFLRTPNLTSGISGAIENGNPYIFLLTGTIKDSWVFNSNQNISSSAQKFTSLRLTNIIPSWATGYGKLEFSSFVLIKDNSNFTDLY